MNFQKSGCENQDALVSFHVTRKWADGLDDVTARLLVHVIAYTQVGRCLEVQLSLNLRNATLLLLSTSQVLLQCGDEL